MRTIARLIEDRQERYRDHPFIRFLKDDSQSPEARLAYAPFACFFSMTFSEFNRKYIRVENPVGEHEKALNEHAREDETHFRWFLQDLERLGYNPVCTLIDALRFVWSEEGEQARDISHYIIGAAQRADAELKLVLLEAVEATGSVWLDATVAAVRNHPEADKLNYFNKTHEGREADFVASSGHAAIASVVLSDAARRKAPEIINGVFDRMEAFNHELLRRVHAGGADAEFLRRRVPESGVPQAHTALDKERSA